MSLVSGGLVFSQAKDITGLSFLNSKEALAVFAHILQELSKTNRQVRSLGLLLHSVDGQLERQCISALDSFSSEILEDFDVTQKIWKVTKEYVHGVDNISSQGDSQDNVDE